MSTANSANFMGQTKVSTFANERIAVVDQNETVDQTLGSGFEHRHTWYADDHLTGTLMLRAELASDIMDLTSQAAARNLGTTAFPWTDIHVTATTFNGVGYSWPVANAVGQLENDGAGNLSWAAGSAITGTGTAGRVALWTGATTLGDDADLLFSGTTLTVGVGGTGIIKAGSGRSLAIQRQDGTAWATLSTGTGNTVMGPTGSIWGDNVALIFGTSSDSRMEWDTAETNDAWKFGTNVGSSAASGNYIFTALANIGVDHLYATSADPRLYIASTTLPADNWMSFHHNGVSGFITASQTTDDLVLSSWRRVNGGDGTAAIPFYTFNSQGNMGMFRNGATTDLGFSKDGVERMSLSSTAFTLAGSVDMVWTGSTSGTITHTPAAITTNHTLTWPANFGAAGAVLTDAAGNGTLSWAVSSAGNVSNTGTPVNDQLAVWTSATVIEGTTALKFTGGFTLEVDANNVAAVMVLRRTPIVTAGAGEVIGNLRFSGEDSASNDTPYGSLRVLSHVVTSGSEVGRMQLRVQFNGALATAIDIYGDSEGVVINQDQANRDWRVAGDGRSHVIGVQAVADNLVMHEASFPAMNSMARGTYIGQRLTEPTANAPTNGLYMTVLAGELQLRGQSAPYNVSRGVMKAWASYDQTGTPAVLDSENVASITDNAAGRFTPLWANDFANTSYVTGGLTTDDGVSTAFITEEGTGIGSNHLVGSNKFASSSNAGGVGDRNLNQIWAMGDL